MIVLYIQESSEQAGLKINDKVRLELTNYDLLHFYLASALVQTFRPQSDTGKRHLTREISRCIFFGWLAFGRLRHIFKNMHLKLDEKEDKSLKFVSYLPMELKQ